MKKVQNLFIDKVSGDVISEYIDRYGDRYMAACPFYFFNFRVPK